MESLTLRSDRWRRFLLNSAVCVTVLCFSLYLAPRISVHQLVLFVTAVAAVGFIVALVMWPGLDVISLIVASLFVPFSISTGTESSINAGILALCGVTALSVLDNLRRKNPVVHWSRPYLPLLALVSVATFSFLLGIRPEEPFAETAPLRTQIGGLAIFWLSALGFSLPGQRLRDTRWIQIVMWTFIVIGAAYICSRLVAPLHSIVDHFQPGAAYSLFYVWLVAFAFGQALMNRRLALWMRFVLLGVVGETLFLGFFKMREWNSGWVPPLVAIMVILCVGMPKLGMPLAILAGALGVLERSVISRFFLTDYKQWDILTREAAWGTLVPIMKVNPLLGIGPANYYWYTPLYPILGYSVHFNSHNNYVDLFLQTGAVGVLCFVWFILEFGILGWRLRRVVAPGFEQAYVCCILGATAGTLVAGFLGDWFLPFAYNVGLTGTRSSLLGWVFLGTLVVFARMQADVVRGETSGSRTVVERRA